MPHSRFALVAYVRLPAGQFVENLRHQLHPQSPEATAHLTILPPRLLKSSEKDALDLLEEVCSTAESFEVTLDSVESFAPVTPTLYIRVGRGSSEMRDLHGRLNRGALAGDEQWPYMPHMTIAKMESQESAEKAYHAAREGWAQFAGSRTVTLKHLTFVREEQENCWVDLAAVTLGARLAKR